MLEKDTVTFIASVATVGRGLFVALALASATKPALAQSGGQPGDTKEIPVVILERCATCHIASEFHDDDAGIDAPRFSEIRADPDTYTAGRLRTFLADPHWPMSQFILSPKDIDRIVAYLTGDSSAE